MSGRDPLTNYRLSLSQAGLVILALHDFAFLLIAHVSNGGALDDDALAAIRTTCLRNLKNADASGTSIEQQAEVFRKAVENVEQLMNDAIRRGRQPQQP